MRVAVLALSVVLLASASAAMTPVEIKKDYGDAVVTITTYSAAEDAIGLGSGFIVDPSGVIVTCYHVINEAYPAVIKLINGASFQEIWVLGCDSAKDVAVIKVKGRDLPTVKLARSDDVEVGEHVVAIGNPRGLENTISDGLLSGVRDMESFNLLQISAPISPGSSGGPVFNSSGRVVGIAAATLTESQNLNFCVPIRYARPLLACTSSVSLEEFSRGLKPSEAATSFSMAGGARREFLRALIPMLRAFWEVDQQRYDRYRPVVSDLSDAIGVLAQLREKADEALRRCLGLKARDAELRRILQRYTDLAQRRFDAYDIMLGSSSEVSVATGLAKLQNVDEEVSSEECGRIIVRDLACQYLMDAGVKVNELGARLPSIFDSLPAVLAMGVEMAVRGLGPTAAGATSLAAADQRGLGFMSFYDLPGIVVDTVFEETQARKAGLQRHDVVTGANDTLRFGNMWDYDMFRSTQPVGVPFTLNVLRDGRRLRLTASFASQ